MHPETLDEKTKVILDKIKTSEIVADFYFGGGAARNKVLEPKAKGFYLPKGNKVLEPKAKGFYLPKGNKVLEPKAKGFYLAGGTALAIQLGHRRSIDLDWFKKGSFSAPGIKSILSGLGKTEVISEDKETLNCLLDGVKISFFQYNYKQLFPLIEFNGFKMADERDIAAMKLSAISSRGGKKDFIDLYFLLKKYSLKEIIGFFENKYNGIKYNNLHLLKSLTYFEDADNEPMPIMIMPVDWDDVKRFVANEANDILKCG
jgi:hypothetical protein